LLVEDEPYMADAIRERLRLEAIAADIAGDRLPRAHGRRHPVGGHRGCLVARPAASRAPSRPVIE
jgi:hypothetical protein